MRRFQANLLLTLAALIWGSSFVVQQIGVGTLGTVSFTGARFLVGGLLVLPLAWRQYRQVQQSARPMIGPDWQLLCLVGAVLFTGAALQQYGILHTSVSNSGFLTGLYVPLVPILSLIVLRRPVHRFVWPASLLCFLGTYLISGAQAVALQKGDLWVIASTLFWASHVLLVGFMAARTQAPLVVASAQFIICGLLGLTVGALLEAPGLADFGSAIFGIAYVGLFSVGMAFTLQVVGQRYTPPADAAIILSSESVFAALAGAIFLGERLATVQISGAALIMTGILAVELLPMTRLGRPRALT